MAGSSFWARGRLWLWAAPRGTRGPVAPECPAATPALQAAQVPMNIPERHLLQVPGFPPSEWVGGGAEPLPPSPLPCSHLARGQLSSSREHREVRGGHCRVTPQGPASPAAGEPSSHTQPRVPRDQAVAWPYGPAGSDGCFADVAFQRISSACLSPPACALGSPVSTPEQSARPGQTPAWGLCTCAPRMAVGLGPPAPVQRLPSPICGGQKAWHTVHKGLE